MDYKKLVKNMLNVGVALLKNGAEVSRVEDSMYRLCRAYGFVHADIWVIYSNIQATVETEEGEIITQVRHIGSTSIDYEKLDKLNNQSRCLCKETPEPEEISRRLKEIDNDKPLPVWIDYAAGIMGGVGFGVFFGCDLRNALVAVVAAIVLVFVGRRLDKVEHNIMIYNFIQGFCTEVFILLAAWLGLASNPSNITLGIVMLMISGLSFTYGMIDLMHRDTLSGLLKISNSIIGAFGIALGIAAAMFLLKGVL